jgi:REP-associated tyrosine transposase
MGGWSAVLSSRKPGERNIADQRILGDAEFVSHIVSGLDDRTKKNLRPSGQRITIETLGDRVSEKFGIFIEALKSGGRRQAVVNARRFLSWVAVTELGYSGAEVARFLGVTNSCVTRIIAIGEKPDLDSIALR